MPTPVLISVVIRCYNALPWLPETLASVLAQGDCVTEIIVVDDGSTDGSVELVTSQFPQIRVLHSERRGPSFARNLGWQTACGEWIQFLDADDLLVRLYPFGRRKTGGIVRCAGTQLPRRG